MRSLSAAELIRVWERGASEAPVERALALLAAGTDEDPQELARLSVGRRDAHLLEVHEQLFGRKLAAFVECSQCKERLEYTLSTDAFAGAGSAGATGGLALQVSDTSFKLRLPDSVDLRAVTRCGDIFQARRILVQRCIVDAHCKGRPVEPETLADESVERIAEFLATADPLGEMLIDLTCPACGNSWQIMFDIESFLWAKVTALAKRLLHEVHVLATAYGWAERDILAMAAARRQFYLEMAG